MSDGASTEAHAAAMKRAWIALAIGVFGIGWSAILVKLSGVPGSVSAFYRMLVAVAVFVPWWAVHRRRLADRRPRSASPEAYRRAVLAAVVAGSFFAVDLALYNTAIMVTSAANATLLGTNAPIFVALIAWFLYDERPTHRFWIGFACALVGMAAIVGTDLLRNPSLGVGDAMALGGAAAYAAYLIAVQRSRAQVDPLTFSAISAVVSTAVLLVVCLAIGAPLVGFSPGQWGALVALGLVSQVIGHFGISYALGRLPVGATSIVLLAQAPITAVLAYPILGERVGVPQVAGGILVLVGIAVVTRR